MIKLDSENVWGNTLRNLCIININASWDIGSFKSMVIIVNALCTLQRVKAALLQALSVLQRRLCQLVLMCPLWISFVYLVTVH